MRASAGFLLFLFALTGSTGTFAQTSTSDQDARMHFEAGRSYFDRARYDDAIREFDEAFRLSGRVSLLINISRSHEAAGHTQLAADTLQRWLDTAEATDPMRPEIESRLARLRLQLDAEATRRAEEEARAANQPAISPTDAAIAAQPTEAAPVAPAPHRSPMPFVLIGGGVAAAGVGAALLALGYGDVHTVENPAPGTAWTDAADIQTRAERRLGVGYALIGVGVATTVGGVIWRVASAPDDDREVAIHVLPTGVAVRGSF